MYEGFLLLALVAVVVLAIRPGTANPVVIHQAGLHATLAPQLQRTQGFLEQIANSFAGDKTCDIATRYFDASDQAGRYLLAAGLRSGVFYFQAILPPLKGDDAQMLRLFSEQVMIDIPCREYQDNSDLLLQAVGTTAKLMNITCFKFPD
ncbi:MAG TPA: hypothetical protein DE312_10255 [Gallionella sp.]|jgi:hypothetical protein|nr:MAG: hypothetical protein A2Z87_01680 [Gallionellales bacterium GWA2_54_124]OGT20695.1 MAG: hypothetical protein A2522_04075 [Gallionellales bacterium RIFOXYD12_FULL_53_10]OGT24012.1 MAG: hypothetical protein A3K00_08890 [Gallionellales bacterium RIFOXYD2_FULL_52_7]HCI53677.1 hypothetical protein [Gallionella sp.]